MALLDIVIEVLKINCSIAQCSGYASEIEAIFYLLFFPTVFIILFVWVVTGTVMERMGGTQGGMRIIISVALYAFIVFQGYYSLFVALSKLWWLLLATLAGLYIFIRRFIHGGGGFSGIGGGRGRGFSGFVNDKVRRRITGEEKDLEKEIRDAFNQLEHFYKEIKNNSGEGREIASTNFRDQQTRLRSLITDYAKFGKVEISEGVKVNLTKQAEKYWDEYGKWSEEYKKINK